jgi:beta-lactamase class A
MFPLVKAKLPEKATCADTPVLIPWKIPACPPMKYLLIAITLFGVTHSLPSAASEPKMDPDLQRQLTALVDGFRGEVGVFVRHLKSGATAAVAGDGLFPTASMIKVPIAVGVFDKIEKGELTLDQKLTYDPEEISYPFPGECLIASLRPGENVRLNKLLLLMLALSDNHASLWCQALAGTGTRINALMEEQGFDQIKVNSRTEGRHSHWQEYGWGQTTPRQMAELVAAIREGRVLSHWTSESLYRYLSGSAYHDEALSAIPPFVQAATKQGAVSHSRSEVALINAPSGDYVFCVITKNQEDRSWGADNEGYVLIRNISRLLWNHFEPDSKWMAATSPPGPEGDRSPEN